MTIQDESKIRHDLLTPVNQIIGYSEMLAEDANKDGQTQYLSDLKKITQAGRNLTDQINLLFKPSEVKIEIAQSTSIIPTEIIIPANSDNDLTGKILIVDDIEDNRDILARRLKKRGYHYEMAENGAIALSKIKQEKFDLVLLDITMPEIDGYTVLKTMKADNVLRNIPVIMISAITEMDSIVRCIEMGAEDYLPKPFNATLLYARVQACLDKKRLLEQEKNYLSERLQTEATLERHRSLAQMVAGVAHEINTPLGVINTAATILDSRVNNKDISDLFADNKEALEDIMEATDLIKRNITRAHNLVQNFKKISVNQTADIKESVNILNTIEESIELFKINAKQAKLEIILQDNVKNGKAWLGYPGYLTQIIINFLTNIERYAYPNNKGGKVIIDLANEEQNNQTYFVITVTDFGQGISSENVTKVFDPFFTTGRMIGGSGLGLAIVHNLITNVLEGSIKAHSELGKGTIFCITLPTNC
ncbi:MAG: response regulator [Methylococcales bacterium]